MSETPAPPDAPDEPVPRLPYGRGLKFSGPELFRIAMTIIVLVTVIALAKPCSNAVSGFVMGFGSGSAAKAPAGAISPVGSDLIPLKGMTDEQVKATVENAQQRARARVNTANAAGSAHAGPNAAGSATAPRSANAGSAK